MGDGILKTLLSAVIGKWLTDEKEAAFANNKMWQCLGISAIFFSQDYIKLGVKLAIVFISWCFGIIGLLIECFLKRKKAEDLNYFCCAMDFVPNYPSRVMIFISTALENFRLGVRRL